MYRNLFAVKAAALALAVFLAVLAGGSAHAAGEWEWTAGQGWIRGAGVARPTPKEQLHYAYELEKKSEFMDAARQYFLLVQNFPASDEAGVGLQRLARCLFEMENYWTSYKAIEQVIETYPNTGRMSDLVEIELRIARKLQTSQTPDILSSPKEANDRDHNIRRSIQILSSVIEHDPYGPVAAEAYLYKGEGHLFLNEISAAKTAFETIRDEFPRSDFVERARLGILQCDQLMGQANAREVSEQMEVVREFERERGGDGEEMEEVESSIKQLNEVEAGKMMDQAEQYRRMGTRSGVQASEFLYKEIVRRYPGTPQAEDAMSRLGNIKMPKQSNRVAKVFKGIKLNPFSYNRDAAPPWIVPQMAPEDMVMVDKGLGPIAGVPETGLPDTAYSPSVRPAGLRDQGDVQLGMADGPVTRGGAYSPVNAVPAAGTGTGSGPGFHGNLPVNEPPPAPARVYSSDPNFQSGPNSLAQGPGGMGQNRPAPGGMGPNNFGGMGPGPQSAPPPPMVRRQPPPPSNPLQTVSEDDLIGTTAPAGMFSSQNAYGQDNGGFGQNGGFGNQNSGFGQNTGYGNQNGGFGNQNSGFGTQNVGFNQNQNSGFSPNQNAGGSFAGDDYTHPYQSGGVYASGGNVGTNSGYNTIPASSQRPQQQNIRNPDGSASLGSPDEYHVPFSDLVGPVPRSGSARDVYAGAGNNGGSYYYNDPYSNGATTSAPGFVDGYGSGNGDSYSQPAATYSGSSGSGGWTFSDDLR